MIDLLFTDTIDKHIFQEELSSLETFCFVDLESSRDVVLDLPGRTTAPLIFLRE